jgi:urea transport system permease protein
MGEVADIVVSGLATIATLVVVSAGLAVVFGLMRVVNMAHGEFLMLGALVTTTLVLHLHVPLWLAMACATLVGAAVGAILEVVLISRIYRHRVVDSLLITFGLSLVMYQVAVDVFGTTPPGVGTPLGAITVGKYSFPAYTLVLVAAALLMLAGLYLLFTRTRYGLLARAAAQNPEMAQALGVAAKRINLITFAIGCALASLGGAIMAPMVSVSPSMGQEFIGQAFMAVVIAGPAFISGTLLSALMLGGVSAALAQSATALWGVTGLFLTAIVVLRLKPTGISGKWRRGL